MDDVRDGRPPGGPFRARACRRVDSDGKSAVILQGEVEIELDVSPGKHATGFDQTHVRTVEKHAPGRQPLAGLGNREAPEGVEALAPTNDDKRDRRRVARDGGDCAILTVFNRAPDD